MLQLVPVKRSSPNIIK